MCPTTVWSYSKLSKMKTARGFTLVELIMTLVIIGVLAAVVGPRFFDRKVFDERLFFEETVSAVRYAQKLALASGCLTQVNLDAGGYRLRRAANCASGDYIAEVQGPDGQTPFANTEVPAGVSVSATNFPVVFDCLIDKPIANFPACYVTGYEMNLVSRIHFIKSLLALVRASTVNYDICAFGYESLCNASTYTSGSASNQRYLSFKFHMVP